MSAPVSRMTPQIFCNSEFTSVFFKLRSWRTISAVKSFFGSVPELTAVTSGLANEIRDASVFNASRLCASLSDG